MLTCSAKKEISTMKINTKSSLQVSMEDGLEVNAEKTKYMFMLHHQNKGQIRNLIMANKSFKYLVTILTNQN
jgi:hypothetical protein